MHAGPHVGTINLLAVSPLPLAPPATLEAISIITQGRTAAVMDLCLRTGDGRPVSSAFQVRVSGGDTESHLPATIGIANSCHQQRRWNAFMFLATLDDNRKDAVLALAANIAPPCDSGFHQSELWRECLAKLQLPERTRIGWDDIAFARVGGVLGYTTGEVDAFFDWVQRHAAVIAEAKRIGEDCV